MLAWDESPDSNWNGLVSYTYSVAATLLFENEVFYEAVAMLTTFSLAGHWLEMRRWLRDGQSRRSFFEGRAVNRPRKA